MTLSQRLLQILDNFLDEPAQRAEPIKKLSPDEQHRREVLHAIRQDFCDAESRLRYARKRGTFEQARDFVLKVFTEHKVNANVTYSSSTDVWYPTWTLGVFEITFDVKGFKPNKYTQVYMRQLKKRPQR